ncbi:hypothetical protein L6164_002533 [Bauhinia variegata]|uniref:Uncharacterized protein n=1 Tax=Bauhinia variegata TaxID=167791 RepID=A0ACB9Q172_BAUVA|nr:hypothetical protein L6164_002533 [Bauhinia variegata]
MPCPYGRTPMQCNGPIHVSCCDYDTRCAHVRNLTDNRSSIRIGENKKQRRFLRTDTASLVLRFIAVSLSLLYSIKIRIKFPKSHFLWNSPA